MTAVLPAVHSAERTDIVTWDIGGDAAKDGEPKQGLGAWFYGVWWCAPLGDWPALADAHITCLELVEVGLGVVMTARWLAEAKRIRLRADAAAAFLTLRARRDDGSLARGARAAELVTAHEVLMQQPEWKQLHDGRREILTEHTFGESMLLHDAASRNNPELIRDVSAALGIVPKQIELSARARAYLQDVSNALLDSRRGAAAPPCRARGAGARTRAHRCTRRGRAASTLQGTPRHDGNIRPPQPSKGHPRAPRILARRSRRQPRMAGAAEALQTSTALIDAITTGSGAYVAATKDLRRTCAIDDDDVFGMLEEASLSLEGLAVSADAAFTDTEATVPQVDSDDEM